MAGRWFFRNVAVLAFTVVALHSDVRSQAVEQGIELNRYVVYFKDKATNPFSIYNPSAFLSPRAIERRSRQSIQIDQKDLPLTPQYLQSVSAAGCTVLNKSKWLNAVTVKVNDSTALQQLKSLPFVKDVKLIAAYKPPVNTVGVIRRPYQLAASARNESTGETYGMGLQQIDILNGIGLHSKGFDGNGVLIAIFDAGFHNADIFPGLQHIYSEGRLFATRDFVNPAASVYNNANHGTQCFSIIGNNAPGIMTGTAPGASFVLCHTEDGGSEFPIEEFNWAAAAEYADSIGADVIASSLGYSRFDVPALNHTYADMDGNTTIAATAADNAAAKGIIVVNSAGNSGNNDWYYITTPADADSILAVGAVDVNEVATVFSSRGYSSDGRVKPDVMAMGFQTFIAKPDNLDYGIGSGTSFAAPAISGLAACLYQAHPTRTAHEIIQAIRRSADRYHNPDSVYGYGIPDFGMADLILSDFDLRNFSGNPAPMIYPNPFGPNVSVIHYSAIEENGRVEVYDMMGHLMTATDVSVTRGYNQLVTTFTNYPPGMYVIRLVTESKSYELKAIHR